MEITLKVKLTEEELRHAVEDYLTTKDIKALVVEFSTTVSGEIEAEVIGKIQPLRER